MCFCVRFACVCIYVCLDPGLHCIGPVPVGHGGTAHTNRCPKWRPAAAPVPAVKVALRVHVSAMREQRRHHRRVPFASRTMERRSPAVQRARPHTAARAAGACRACVCLCACACVRVFVCLCVYL